MLAPVTPFYEQDGITIYCGNCLEVMPQLEENSIDTIITDPPYGLEFMGKDWDRGVPGISFWQAALQVAKPGAMLLAFGGTRTHYRLMCAIEDAGWEIRDVIMWVYGSGFPKSHDISKAIDKMRRRDYVQAALSLGLDIPGNSLHDWTKAEHSPSDEWWEKFKAHLSSEQWQTIEREVIGYNNRSPGWFANGDGHDITAPATEPAKLWDGWGTALKPAWEPIIIAMKPRDGTFANNALEHGVAGLWVDGGRIAVTDDDPNRRTAEPYIYGKPNDTFLGSLSSRRGDFAPNGRWPANLIHDGSDEVVGLFPITKNSARPNAQGKLYSAENGVVYHSAGKRTHNSVHSDQGSAARFFYCAKASCKERGEGNNHPTVKPLALMRYLCRLTKTPTGGKVLDMFAGSGTTLVAAKLENREAKGIEIDKATCQIIVDRLHQYHSWQMTLDLAEAAT